MDFPKVHKDIADHSIMIGGLYRSGTTILGKLLGSLRNAEYIFEPPMVLHLDALIEEKGIDPQLAAELLRTNLAEDYMLNYLHGRRYNMRPNDDSSIFVTKTYEESVGRWVKIKRLKDALEYYRQGNFRLIFKNAAKYTIMPVLLKNYSSFKIVEIVRDLRNVLCSLLARGWFSDKTIKEWEYGIWPFAQNNIDKVPFVGEGSDIEDYLSVNEETRAVDFINTKMKCRFEMKRIIDAQNKDAFYTVKYEDMLENPRKTVTDIAAFLGMEVSSKTEELIKTVNERNQSYDVDEILSRCGTEITEKLFHYNQLLGYDCKGIPVANSGALRG